jgi:hypothetical protein
LRLRSASISESVSAAFANWIGGWDGIRTLPNHQRAEQLPDGIENLKYRNEIKLLVPRRGLEPPLPCENYDLNVARLPIPPSGHGVGRRGCIGQTHCRQRPNCSLAEEISGSLSPSASNPCRAPVSTIPETKSSIGSITAKRSSTLALMRTR